MNPTPAAITPLRLLLFAGLLAMALGFAGFTSGQADADMSTQVIRGESAPAGSWPSMVYVGGCGGTLIHPRWVLTAAHCRTPKTVTLGTHRPFKKKLGAGFKVKVVSSVIHPGYDSGEEFFGEDGELNEINPPGYSAFDAKLLKLKRRVSLPVMPLARVDDGLVDGEDLMIAGWGVESMWAEELPRRLMQAQLDRIPVADCSLRYGPMFNDEVHVCAHYSEPGNSRSSCYGDSGGPLTAMRPASGGGPGVPTQVGIVSWGEPPCGQWNNFGVYTRVTAVSGWVDEILGPFRFKMGASSVKRQTIKSGLKRGFIGECNTNARSSCAMKVKFSAADADRAGLFPKWYPKQWRRGWMRVASGSTKMLDAGRHRIKVKVPRYSRSELKKWPSSLRLRFRIEATDDQGRVAVRTVKVKRPKR